MPFAGNQLQPKEIFVCNIPSWSYQQEVLVRKQRSSTKQLKKYLYIFMKSKLSLFTTVPQDLTFRLAHQRTSMTASCDLYFLELATVVQVPALLAVSDTTSCTQFKFHHGQGKFIYEGKHGSNNPPPPKTRNFFSLSSNF